MIKIICLLAIIGLGQGLQHEVPTRAEIESSINRTIEEVERMVRSDPSLPRLSRKEIIDILYNITSTDVNTLKNKDGIDVARSMYQKALMVVLPYNAKDSSESLKDLYTKPPMIQMIPDSNMNGDNAPFPEEGIQVYTQKNSEEDNIVATYTSVETTAKAEKETTEHRYKNHRETYSDVQTRPSILEKLKSDSSPMRFSFNLENLQKGSYNMQKPDTITRRPVYHRDTTEKVKSTTPSKLEIVYSTPPAEEVKRKGSEGIIIDLKPSLPSPATTRTSSTNILTSDQWRYYAPPTTTQKPVTSAIAPEKSLDETMDDEGIFTTIRVVVGNVATETSKRQKTTDKNSMNEENIEDSTFSPAVIKSLSRDRVIPTMKTKVMEVSTKESSKKDNGFMYVTPIASSTSEDVSENSMYTTNSVDVGSSTAKTVTPMRKEIEELLESIGLRSNSKINIEDIYKKNKEIFESKFQIPDTNSVLYTPTSALTSVAADTPSISNQNTFENPVSDFRKGMDNLSPDVQLLFQRFGLQSSQQRQALEASTTTTNAPKLTINFNSYTNFKPLPASKVKDQEMKEFLAQFGLGINDGRNQKAMKPQTERPSLIEAVPNNMRQILENIGLIMKTTPVPEKVPATKAAASTQFHVFKPHEAVVKDEKQRMKINELLDVVKMVQQGAADVKDVQKIAAELLTTAKTLKDGPDPLSLEEILNLYSQDLKNEVKREQEVESEEKQEQKRQTTADEEEEKPSLIATATTESMDATTTTTTSSPTSEASSTISPESRDSSTASSLQSGSTTAFSWDFVDALTSTTTSASPVATAAAEPSNIDALADSFGGSTQAPDPVLPTKPRSGFYFLVDWNTFLEVGEEGKDKVNLRFQPKVGDPNRFISVRVP